VEVFTINCLSGGEVRAYRWHLGTKKHCRGGDFCRLNWGFIVRVGHEKNLLDALTHSLRERQALKKGRGQRVRRDFKCGSRGERYQCRFRRKRRLCLPARGKDSLKGGGDRGLGRKILTRTCKKKGLLLGNEGGRQSGRCLQNFCGSSLEKNGKGKNRKISESRALEELREKRGEKTLQFRLRGMGKNHLALG